MSDTQVTLVELGAKFGEHLAQLYAINIALEKSVNQLRARVVELSDRIDRINELENEKHNPVNRQADNS